MIKVYFFGDSVCVGQHVAIHKGWIPKISSELSVLEKKIKCPVVVANASVNGRTTRQALEVMPYEIQSQKVDILIIQFGMNDCNYWKSDRGVPRVSPESFAANLEEMISRAITFNVKKIFLNTNHPSAKDQEVLPYTNITYQESNQQYNQIIRETAKKFSSKTVLNDVEMEFNEYTQGNRDKLLELLLPYPDYLHPNELGHTLYFNVVYPKIKNSIMEITEKN